MSKTITQTEAAEQRAAALESFLTYSEPAMPTAEDDDRWRTTIYEPALAAAGEMSRQELESWVRWAAKQRKVKSREGIKLSRAQINLAGMLTKLAGEPARELSRKMLNDERHEHISMFTDKQGATDFMLALLDLIHPESRPAMPELDAALTSNNNPTEDTTMSTTTETPAAEPKPAAAKRTASKRAASKRAAAKPAAKPAAESAGFEWPKPFAELLLEYLRERISTDADAPAKGLPHITESGILRVRGEDWREWLAAQEIAAPKAVAAAAMRDGLGIMKALPIAGEGRAMGFYQGPAPAGTEDLPRRAGGRSAGAPKRSSNPFARFDAEALGLLNSAVNNYPKRAGGELRVQLLEQIAAASEALGAAAAAADAESAGK